MASVRGHHMNQNCLKEHDLFEKLKQIYNCDETGFCVDGVSKNRVMEASGVSASRDERITVLFAANADDEMLLPLIVHRWKNLWTSRLGDHESPGTLRTLSSDGGWRAAIH